MVTVSFPAWNAGIGINYYFLPWMGIGTGAEFASYASKTVFDKPWTQTTYDKYGTQPWCLYTMTSTPYNMSESQNIYMVEIPLALKFRARPGRLGFIGTAGVKLGIPIQARYNMPTGGYFENKVYYEYFDLLMEDVPTVIEDVNIPGSAGTLGIGSKASGPSLRMLNYAAHLELGMLIQVHKRVDLAISAFGTYYFNDVMSMAPSNSDSTTAPWPASTRCRTPLRTTVCSAPTRWSRSTPGLPESSSPCMSMPARRKQNGSTTRR